MPVAVEDGGKLEHWAPPEMLEALPPPAATVHSAALSLTSAGSIGIPRRWASCASVSEA